MRSKFQRAEIPVLKIADLQKPQLNLLHAKCISRVEMNIMRDQKEQRDVGYYILAYLSDNPDAGDTFDGLVEWWLLDQKIKFETRNVSEAVARLISAGLIVEHEEADSRIIYRVNQDKKKDIRRILNEIRA